MQATVEAVRTVDQLPAVLRLPRIAAPPPEPDAPLPEPPARLRCRLGLHRWLPLALSVHGAGAGLSVSFCRDCPRVRRPAGPHPRPLSHPSH